MNSREAIANQKDRGTKIKYFGIMRDGKLYLRTRGGNLIELRLLAEADRQLAGGRISGV